MPRRSSFRPSYTPVQHDGRMILRELLAPPAKAADIPDIYAQGNANSFHHIHTHVLILLECSYRRCAQASNITQVFRLHTTSSQQLPEFGIADHGETSLRLGPSITVRGFLVYHRRNKPGMTRTGLLSFNFLSTVTHS